MYGLAVSAALLLMAMIAALLARSWPLLRSGPLIDLLLGTTWLPYQEEFGFWPFVASTVFLTGLAMAIAVPICTLSAVYLAEYASPGVRSASRPVIDLLAGTPSVVYGLWGVLLVVPLIRDHVGPWLDGHLGQLHLFSTSGNSTGYGVLAGSVVLAVMVSPVIVSVMVEVLRAAPDGLREAAMALGLSRWVMVRRVLLPRALSGVFAAVVLGFSRAFGETMAVMMVVGNVPQAPTSIFDAAYPLTALIANNYGEMMSVPLYDAALMAAALVLLLLIVAFNLAARIVLRRVKARYRG
jgi:phosphate transport system permease protein